MKNTGWKRFSRQKIQSGGGDGLFLQVVGGILFLILSLCGRFVSWIYEKLKVYRLFQPKILMLIAGGGMVVNTVIDWSINMNWAMDPSGAMYWTILEIIQIASVTLLIFCFYFPTKARFIILLISIGLLAVTSVIRPFLGNVLFTIAQLLSFIILYLWELGYQRKYFTMQPLRSMQLFSNALEEEEDVQIENMNKKLAYIKKDNQKKEDEKTVGFTRFYWMDESFLLSFVVLFLGFFVTLIGFIIGNDAQIFFTGTNLLFVTFLSLLFYPYVLGLCSRIESFFRLLCITSLSQIGQSFSEYRESNEKEIFSYTRNQKQVLKRYQETKSIRKNVRIEDTYHDIQLDIPVEYHRVANETYYEKDNYQSLIKLAKFSGLTVILFPVRLIIFYFSPVLFSIFFIISMLANRSFVKKSTQ